MISVMGYGIQGQGHTGSASHENKYLLSVILIVNSRVSGRSNDTKKISQALAGKCPPGRSPAAEAAILHWATPGRTKFCPHGRVHVCVVAVCVVETTGPAVPLLYSRSTFKSSFKTGLHSQRCTE